MNRPTWRIAAWTLFLITAVARPGVDVIDRWLVGTCWDVPSEWNAVADAALRTGVVDARIGGSPAPWRQASVLPLEGARVAVVTVSDMAASRSTFISERYDVLGILTRATTEPSLVTDEARGYKPLSHLWPLVRQDGRLKTLIAMAPLRSDPLRFGLFAYVALGAADNELLFVCRLDPGPGPTWGELVRVDMNRDGVDDDLAVFERGERNEPPIATFRWDTREHGFVASTTPRGRELVAWWSPEAGERIAVPRDAAIDEAIGRIASRLRPQGR